MLRGPLHWLGAVDLAEPAAGDDWLMSLTAWGARRLGMEVAQPDEGGHRPLQVREDFAVLLPLSASLYDRFRVERFAQWQSSYPQYVYQINQRSLRRAVEGGLAPAQILSFLESRTSRHPRACGGRPAEVPAGAPRCRRRNRPNCTPSSRRRLTLLSHHSRTPLRKLHRPATSTLPAWTYPVAERRVVHVDARSATGPATARWRLFTRRKQMKAVRYTRYGAPEVLRVEEVETPAPGANELLVKVQAATVSAGDLRMRAFKVPAAQWIFARLFLGILGPRRQIPGMELAGIVESVGPGVT